MSQNLEQTLKSLEERIKELETKFKALSSILGEYVAQLQVLEESLVNTRNIKNTMTLEKNSLDSYAYDTQGTTPRERHIEPSIPLSSLAFATIEDYETPTDELKRKIANVAELIIKTGNKLDYISAR
ncbi:MAG: hypothetical protein QXR89_03195 [Candidatus Bathyarchaeia archaeon]